MNNYLLDTHTALWFFEDNPALSKSFESLPIIHRDPFDRLLIATAIAEEITLITDDRNITLYDVKYIW